MTKNKKVNTIAELINLAAADNTIHAFIDYQIISADELEKIKEETGLDLDVSKRTITTDDIRHAINKHSNDSCPLQYEDIMLIDIITRQYDIIYPGGVSKKTKLQTIAYEKVIGNKYFVVEEIRAGRKKLAFKTMYKKKIKKR
jgi:hypothetical protein